MAVSYVVAYGCCGCKMKEMHRLHNSFYSNAGFHHVGVACKYIKTTLNELLIFLPKDIECSDLIHDAKLDATLQLIKLNAQTYLELVSGNVVEGILRKRLYLYQGMKKLRLII